MSLSELLVALVTRFRLTGNLADLDEAIEVGRRAAEATPDGDPDQAMVLSNLGGVLRMRFGQAGDLSDLDEAIEYGRRAAEAMPDDPAFLSNFGISLLTRFGRTGDLADLDLAIGVLRQAAEVSPEGDRDQATILSNLSSALLARFKQTANPADLDQALEFARRAAETAERGDANRAMFLSNLGNAFRIRFARAGEPADLDQAVEYGREAVEATSEGNPDRAMFLSNLTGALLARHELTGNPADLDEIIVFSHQAAEARPGSHADRTMFLSNLAAALQARSQRTEDPADLDLAIELGRQTVEATPAGHLDQAGFLTSLGNALRIRFARTGALADLNEAIEVSRQAAETIPAGHFARARFLLNFSDALQARFEVTGDLADLDRAVETGREAAAATPGGHADRARCLSNLGKALRLRSARTGALADLDEAIEVSRQAAEAAPEDRAGRARYLSSLASALQARFQRTGDLGDLDEAIELSWQAVLTALSGDIQATFLSNLGSALQARFQRTGEAADLDKAIEAGREAVSVIPEGRPRRALFLFNLGIGLRSRFDLTGDPADLDQAIAVSREAVATTPDGHPDRATYLCNLGMALATRFRLTLSPQHAGEATAAYTRAAQAPSAAPSIRILGARRAASLIADSDLARAADLLDAAVRLLPQTVPRQLSRSDQQHALASFAALASDAAALTLRLGQPGAPARALGLLELGRAVLYSQALDTRTDLTDLSQSHPDLAARFAGLRDLLDPAGSANLTPVARAADDDNPAAAHRRAAQDTHRAAAEFAALLTQIRDLDGFGTFLLPPEPGQLTRHASAGPVVAINVSRYRSDAIAVTSAGITSIPLPSLTIDVLTEQATAFDEALRARTEPQKRSPAQETLSQVLQWLWDTTTGPVLDHLGYQSPASGTWPRIWWAPGGPLSGLPLHAAGYHRQRDGRTVIDRVISSYTPTIRALASARAHGSATQPGSSLIVAMPGSPGASPLPGTAREVRLVRERLPEATVLIADSDRGQPPPVKAEVLAHLADADIVHFACHATSDPDDPSRSLLVLQDHDRDPLTIASLAPVRLDHAQLAYLSACQTSRTTSGNLSDEAIHLTSAFQLAGYPHVIGTLWEVNDHTAARTAVMFYDELQSAPGTFDTSTAARALHDTVRALRGQRDAIPQWAAYLHAGA
jgi:CHAT domain-containing protein